MTSSRASDIHPNRAPPQQQHSSGGSRGPARAAATANLTAGSSGSAAACMHPSMSPSHLPRSRYVDGSTPKKNTNGGKLSWPSRTGQIAVTATAYIAPSNLGGDHSPVTLHMGVQPAN